MFQEVKPRSLREAHCNRCGPDTEHEVVADERTRWDAAEGAVTGGSTYRMLKCLGCKAVSLEVASWCSEEEHVAVTRYPPKVLRKQPQWIDDLVGEAGDLPELLNEVYVALQNDLRSLAAMGVRSLLERVMVAKVGAAGTFAAKLTRFYEAGYISALERERLVTIVEAGHAAIHRMFRPSAEDLITLISIAEHVIESVYLHGPKVADLGKRIPAREKGGG